MLEPPPVAQCSAHSHSSLCHAHPIAYENARNICMLGGCSLKLLAESSYFGSSSQFRKHCKYTLVVYSQCSSPFKTSCTCRFADIGSPSGTASRDIGSQAAIDSLLAAAAKMFPSPVQPVKTPHALDQELYAEPGNATRILPQSARADDGQAICPEVAQACRPGYCSVQLLKVLINGGCGVAPKCFAPSSPSSRPVKKKQ